MSMTFEEKKKVVEAAKLLKEHCLERENCDGCVFYDEGNVLTCPFYKNNAADFETPELKCWTPEDVALAKALKAVGAKVIYNTLGRVYWRTDNVYTCGELPNGAFTAIKKCESFSIDTIISEAAEE